MPELDPYTRLRFETNEGAIESLAAKLTRVKAALAAWGFTLPEPDDGRKRIAVRVPPASGSEQASARISTERTDEE